MDMGWMVPVGVVSAMSARAAFTTWVRAKHGYPLDDERGRGRWRGRRGAVAAAPDDGIDDARRIALLTSENERLTGKVGRLEERLAVLERIATDPGTRTYAEIEALRSRP